MVLSDNIEKIPIHFIVSTGRTGSTLLSSMLNAHTNVISVSEEPFCFTLYDGYAGIKHWTDRVIREFAKDFLLFSSGKLGPQFSSKEELEKILLANSDGMNFNKAIRICYFAFSPDKDKSDIRALVSKELIYHSQLRKVLRIYPDAKFILLVRDPRDNIVVKIKRAEKRGSAYSFNHFIIAWRVIYTMLFAKLSQFGKGRFITVKYESLVSDAENELKRISEFLNLSYDPHMLEYDKQIKTKLEKNEAGVSANLLQQMARDHEGLTKKVYTDKIGLWEKNLNQEQVNRIWTANGKLAEQFGYQVQPNFQTTRLGLNYRFRYLFLLYKTVFIPGVYYLIPWSIRKLIRRIRYGKSYIESGYKEKGFYFSKAAK